MQDRFGAFSAKDIANYISNIYHKVTHGLGLSWDEQDFIVDLPDDFLEDVDELKQFQQPLEKEPAVPRARRVEKKEPTQKKLTQEEVDQLMAASPEMTVLNTFFPSVFDRDVFFAEPNPVHIDASINTFIYLRDLGYTTGVWALGPEYKREKCHPVREISGKTPICEFLDGSPLLINDIIQRAQAFADRHSFMPAKAIVALSHPNCRCHVVCYPPVSPEGIPDTAPGLPTFGDPEEILHYKQQIFPKLQIFPVDRWTVLSPIIYEQITNVAAKVLDEDAVLQATPYYKARKHYKKQYKSSSFEEERLKYAESAWVDDVQPIRTSHSYLFKSSLGPIRPVPSDYVGFQLSVTDDYAMVFLGNLSRTIIAPRDCIEIINLRPVPPSELDANTFIRIDDSYGLTIQILEDGKALCYLPDFDEMLTVHPESVFKAS